MNQRVFVWVFLATSTPAHATQNECQLKDGQIWRGVMKTHFHWSGGEGPSGYGDSYGYCAVDATVKVSADFKSLNVTDVSYHACTDTNDTECAYDDTPQGWVLRCKSTLTPQNISGLRCASKSGVCFNSTHNARNCETGNLNFSGFGAQDCVMGNCAHTTGRIGNGSLEITYVMDNYGGGGELTGHRETISWRFFQPPEVLADGVVIQSRETGLCLDLPGGDLTDGNYLSLSKCLDDKSNAHQRWKFVGGQLIYTNSTKPKCVDLIAGNVTNGQRLELWDCAGTPQQQWRYDSTQGTIYLASQLGHGPLKCIDLRYGGEDGDNALQVWDCNYGAWNQQWIVHERKEQLTPQSPIAFLV